MVDVDKLSDGELRTKLIEFGFPVMPITGTTRKVMVRKLKLLLENQNKLGSTDGRRSLGRYSSEEESDADVKATKIQKNRRATMAAPVSSTSRVTRQSIVEPVSRSPKKQIRTTTSTTTRASRIMQAIKDDFDTGSDSESDILKSSKSKPNSDSNHDDSYDVEINSKNSALKTPLSLYSRYTSPKTDDFGYSSTRNTNFSAAQSPSRYTSTFTEIGGTGSLSATYGTDKLNQVRARLSLASPAYENRSSYNPLPANSNVKLTEHDTPFLSNFTRRLSALSAAKNPEHDKTDLVKEHDSNGFTPYSRRPYLSKTARGRDSIYDLKARREGSDRKSKFVSYAVLAVVALFFIVLAVVYLGMASDTSIVSSGYISPICASEEIESKKGVHCLLQEQVQSAINLLNVLSPELKKKSLDYHCTDPAIKPQMSEAEIVKFCLTNYAINNAGKIKNDLRNLEVMIFLNPEWKIDVAQTDTNEVAVTKENIVKNMEQVLFNIDKKVTSLVMLYPELPYKCVIFNYFVSAMYSLAMLGIIFIALFVLRLSLKFYGRYEEKQKEELNSMVEQILDILQNATSEGGDVNYVVINHVRDAILNVKDRTAKQNLWEKAVKYISENESRARTEVQTVHGESCDVWRWIGSANLSMTGEATDCKYRAGRRIVDVQYLINEVLKFPHRTFFFCQSKDVFIKNEVREGFFSIYVLRCRRCLKEQSICSEEPQSDLMDVNLACVAGVLSIRLDLYQLGELCSALRIPAVSGKDFERYRDELRIIYNDSKFGNSEYSFETGRISTSTPTKLSEGHSSNDSERIRAALEDVSSSLEELDLQQKEEAFLQELSKDTEKIATLTVDQSNSDLWFKERQKRLTASNFGRICKLLDKTNRANIVKDLLYSTFKGNVYTNYGKENEDNAIRQFEQLTGKTVRKSGLQIDKKYPFLAASPDGIILEENALVEVKCPYKARDSSIEEAFNNKEILFATYQDGKLSLKREDKYYYQVQGQLHVAGKEFCYFIVWTPKGLVYELIERDELFWEKMLPKLEGFYFSHLLPELLNNI